MDGFLGFVFGLMFGVFVILMGVGIHQQGMQDQAYGWGRTFSAEADGNLGLAVSRCRDHAKEHHDGSAYWIGACTRGVYGDE